ncbi:MAG TPA: YdeI/OmpD-associated family protein [Gaiellaceae bacterium]|nr:YdeI/OmpD-associated family protein [Gaiellaceae bacterium]
MAGEQGKDGRPVLAFASAAEWEAWLAAADRSSDGLWIKLAKRGAGVPSVSFAEALEVALCYGWIDSQAAGYDDRFYLQRFTPRRKRSKWSQINRNRATELIAQGRMKPAGLEQVELAKADGRWDAAYASPANATVPDDLQAALDADPKAAETFAGLSASQRYGVLYRLDDAKRPETRARRLEQFLARLSAGEKPID